MTVVDPSRDEDATRICPVCQEPFAPWGHQRYCRSACRAKAWRRRHQPAAPVVAKWNIWWGGWSFGYRMLIEMTPALIIFLALAWDHLIVRRRFWQPMFWAAATLSVYVHFLGAFFYPSGWNGSPEDVDANPRRVWQVHDTELSRCQAKLMRGLAKRAPLFLKPVHASTVEKNATVASSRECWYDLVPRWPEVPETLTCEITTN